MKIKINNPLTKLPSNYLVEIKSRISYGSLAVAFVITILAPLLLVESAAAYGQVTSRSVELSSSVQSATSVKYTISFTTATTGNIQGVVVDFCSNDPIIGDSCTAPTGFTAGSAVTSSGSSGLNPATTSSWTPTTVNSGRTFEFTDGGGASVNSGTAITFEITGNTNPSTLGTFYGRIFTFATTAAVTTWNSTADGSAVAGVVDAGGTALSTTVSITITSKVQEVITFCVYTSSFDSSPGLCSAVTGSSVALGNNNGVLSTSGPFVDNTTKYDIQTNALNNVTIRFVAPTPYGTLHSGTNTIEASSNSGTGATATTAYASTTGSPQFGLCTWSAGGTTANLTPSSPYNDSNCHSTSESATTATPGGDGGADFGFNISNSTSTYGDVLATEAPGAYAQGEIAFIGNISNTTVAGIYTTTLNFIATGSY